MKKKNLIGLVGICIILLGFSWYSVLISKSNSEKQLDLIEKAEYYLKDDIYIKAVPLLEEASNYNGKYSLEVEEKLKEVYLFLGNQRIYIQRYANLLDRQMKRDNASPEVFIEAANFHFANSRITHGLDVLKDGIRKLGNEELIDIYEKNRYVYETGYNKYEDVTEIFEDKIGVKINGFWGVASSAGDLLIPCEYEKITTFSEGRAIVKKRNEIYAIDINQNRLAVPKENIIDFKNYSNDRLAIKTKDGWKRANGELMIGNTLFEDLGTYSNGYAPAKLNGKWGIINKKNDWIVNPEYDEVIMDILGIGYRQESAFVRIGKDVFLISDGKKFEEAFEDAKAFNEEGYAAVKKNGKWGFINSKGDIMIDFKFEDALSFNKNLAAIKKGDYWGYISEYGKIAIEPNFLEARSFSKRGTAPVLTNSGWQFIRLIEYKQRGGF